MVVRDILIMPQTKTYVSYKFVYLLSKISMAYLPIKRSCFYKIEPMQIICGVIVVRHYHNPLI